MALRFNGRLKNWNAERGFGFIVADDGGQDLFVHISAFARDGQLPVVGEPLIFEVTPDRDGRKRAVLVRRPGAVQPAVARVPRTSAHRSARQPGKSGLGRTLIAFAVVALVGWYAYGRYASRVAQIKAAAHSTTAPYAPATLPAATLPAPSSFQCDNRKYCSQMTSCREAKLFLKNCPGVEMDGNHDGVPCEQQWCTYPFAE